MSQDFSAGISKSVSGAEDEAAAESCQALRASRPIWPSPSDPSSPGSRSGLVKPGLAVKRPPTGNVPAMDGADANPDL